MANADNGNEEGLLLRTLEPELRRILKEKGIRDIRMQFNGGLGWSFSTVGAELRSYAGSNYGSLDEAIRAFIRMARS